MAAYELRISDWNSCVCSSDLGIPEAIETILFGESRLSLKVAILKPLSSAISIGSGGPFGAEGPIIMTGGALGSLFAQCFRLSAAERKTLLVRSEEHTSELQSLMRISYAVFCLKKKRIKIK